MIVLGIDPGQTGAAAMVGVDSGFAWRVVDLDGDPAIIVERLESLYASVGKTDVFAVVERAQTMRGQGIASSGKYMTGYGVILGWLCTRCISHDTIPPGTWKKAMGLTKQKGDSLALARRLFPTMELGRKKDHNRAEALLLAEWCRRNRFLTNA